MNFLREGDDVICDNAYTNYAWEEEMKREGVRLSPIRKVGNKRCEGEDKEREKKRARRLVETVGSVLFRLIS